MPNRSLPLVLWTSIVASGCAGTATNGRATDGGGEDGGRRRGDGFVSAGDGGRCDDPDALDLNGCACLNAGATRSCYTGPAATENKGLCKDGTQTCAAAGEFLAWGPCTGDVTPQKEVCSDNQDHDCNGKS